MSPRYHNNEFYLMRDKIVNEHLDKYPDAGSNTIARILYRDYPDFFIDKENARTVIRIRRGASGERNRKVLKDRRYVKI